VYLNIVPTVRKMLAAQQPDKANCPIIFTELGCDTSRGEAHQAHALVKAYTMGIAQGVDCIQWFEGIDGDSGPMGLLARDKKPRPAYTAMGQMIKHLGLHPSFVGWLMLNDKDYGFVFRGAHQVGDVLITWAPVGETDTVLFKRKISNVDPLTGNIAEVDRVELTEAPVIILNPPDDVVAIAKSNHGKPFAWDGDYTHATSVSVTFGATNIEKGLHTMSAKSVAQDVLAYGGAARAGGVPGGNVFVVDPNFLSYTTTPIEISVTVRRNQANDNAGFKLSYESTTGGKNCGWYTVPDNKQWHTMKWKITDDQFVSMYGFNFSLDSDGNQYNKYDIQNVTVTKLAP
jgi:polysaccharide biosynthesis protein PslG